MKKNNKGRIIRLHNTFIRFGRYKRFPNLFNIMKRKTILLGLLILLLFSGVFFVHAIKQKQGNGNIDNGPLFYQNRIAAPYIPAKVDFAGENVPLDIYWVREALDNELIINCYQHSKTLRIFKRSGRYFPVIEKILAEEGVPEDFKYLCVAESGLENLISPASAYGYWQFLEGTGKSYGLEINQEVDERYHLEKSTRAACRYLKGCKERLGSWTLAAAAYNMGENGIGRAIKNQGTNVYWDLLLNNETARYLYRIISYKLIFEDPQEYGIIMTNADLYYPVPSKEIEITASIPDLYKFAEENSILYRELKTLNPWLRDSKLTVKSKTYKIKIPEKSKMHYYYLYKNLENPHCLIGDTVFHVK